MYGQMTAGSWIYIGSQGIVQGTFETFAEAGRKHFGGSLEGKFVVTGGLGGMGGAQPLAATMNGALFLGIDVDPARIEKRLQSGYCDKIARSLDEGLAMIDTARREGQALSVGLVGNCADVLPEMANRGVVPDVAFPNTWDPKEYGESALENALPWTSITPADFHGRGNFRELTPLLVAKHETRIAKDREFQYWLEDLAEYHKMREQKTLSLVESERKAERDEQEKKRLARVEAREAAGVAGAREGEPEPDDGLDAAEKLDRDDDEEIERPDALLTEAAHILADAIELLQGDVALAQRVRGFSLAETQPHPVN